MTWHDSIFIHLFPASGLGEWPLTWHSYRCDITKGGFPELHFQNHLSHILRLLKDVKDGFLKNIYFWYLNLWWRFGRRCLEGARGTHLLRPEASLRLGTQRHVSEVDSMQLDVKSPGVWGRLTAAATAPSCWCISITPLFVPGLFLTLTSLILLQRLVCCPSLLITLSIDIPRPHTHPPALSLGFTGRRRTTESASRFSHAQPPSPPSTPSPPPSPPFPPSPPSPSSPSPLQRALWSHIFHFSSGFYCG